MEGDVVENQSSASGKLLGSLGQVELYPSVIFYRVKYFLRKKKKEREISMETQGWDACLCDVSADSPRRPMCLPCPTLCQKAIQGVELDTGRSTSSERLPLTEAWFRASVCGHRSELCTPNGAGGRPCGGHTGQGPTRESGWRLEQKVQCAPPRPTCRGLE